MLTDYQSPSKRGVSNDSAFGPSLPGVVALGPLQVETNDPLNVVAPPPPPQKTGTLLENNKSTSN